MRRTAAILLPTTHASAVLHFDTPHTVFHRYDEYHRKEGQNGKGDKVEACPLVLAQQTEAARHLRHDPCENDQRQAIADALLGNQVAEPDGEHRSGSHRHQHRDRQQVERSKAGQNVTRS